jgi:hypothetical protein
VAAAVPAARAAAAVAPAVQEAEYPLDPEVRAASSIPAAAARATGTAAAAP